MVRKISGQSITDREYPAELKRWVDAYLDHLAIRNYSRVTIRQSGYHLLSLLTWFDERSIASLDQITTDVMASYQRYLFHYRQDNGKPLSVTARRARLTSIRSWFRWLRKAGHHTQDPCQDLELPKEERRLPRGVLTASEVSGVDLHGTELVILSACETGLGDVQAGEGVLGLRSAFAASGARTVIMSLWAVRDAPTVELMAELYRFLLKEGAGPADALRRAQLVALAQNRHQLGTPRPSDWAAFVSAGDWR